jgi:hypothetical protein
VYIGGMNSELWAGFSWSTVLTSLVGSGLISLAVAQGLAKHLGDRWLARHKNDLDKEFESYRSTLEQKRKRVEAELSHRVYVTQTHFDAEFKALQDIFAVLGKLRLSFNGLRPDFSWGPTDEKEKSKILVQRLEDFKDKYNQFVSTAESLFPFVPEEIFEHVQICMKTAHIEIAHIETAGPATFTLGWFEDGARQRDKFTNAYFLAAKLTRERIRQLSVVS